MGRTWPAPRGAVHGTTFRVVAADARRVLLARIAGASGLLTVAGFGVQEWGGAPLLARSLEGMAALLGMWLVLPKAVRALLRLRPDMNLLMTIATAGAIALGDWLEAATVAFLFALSLALEGWSTGRARRAIAALLDPTPPTVRITGKDGKDVEVAPEQVAVGARFFVHPGERIPLDGQVTAGESAVDEAPITGESVRWPSAWGRGVRGHRERHGVIEVRRRARRATPPSREWCAWWRRRSASRAAMERWVDWFARCTRRW